MVSGPGDHADLRQHLRALANRVREDAAQLRVVFVTNLRHAPVADLGENGLLNLGQYYTTDQADQIISSLQELGVEVVSFFTEKEFIAAAVSDGFATSGKRPVVYTAAEGGSGSGRRALIPSLCNLLGLPVLNSGPHGCSIARHKFHANAVLARAGVRAPATWMYRVDGWLTDPPPSGARVIVKPTYESSAIGVGDDSVRAVDGDLVEFLEAKVAAFGQPVVLQEFITGEEIGIPLVQVDRTCALPAVSFRRADGSAYGEQPKTFKMEVIDQDASYALYDGPAVMVESYSEAACRAFDALEMSGVGRMDFRVDPDGRAWLFDTNESPPPLAGTSYAVAMQALGFDVSDMLAVWIGVCLRRAGLLSGV